MTMTHTIATERLVHVLQHIASSQQTGRLAITSITEQGSETGEIFFQHGNTVFARTSQASGETALSRMMHWKHFSYTFYEGTHLPVPVPPHRIASFSTLRAETEPLKLKDTLPHNSFQAQHTPPIGTPALPVEQKQRTESLLAQHFVKMARKGVHAIFKMSSTANTPEVLQQLERRDRFIFLLSDGKRTLRDVATLVHRNELEVAHVIVWLLKRGYIEYMDT